MKKLYSLTRLFVLWCLLWAPCLATGQTAPAHARTPGPVRPPELDKSLQFIETGNRHGNSVQFEARVPDGKLFLHPNRFTYAFYDGSKVRSHQHSSSRHKNEDKDSDLIKSHAYSVSFIGANPHTPIRPAGQRPGLYSYFIGNDQSKWASGMKAWETLEYQNLYPGISMRLLEQSSKLKYEFILEPGADPALIRMKYEGAEAISIKNGELVIRTSVNKVTEGRPYTYQVVNGKQEEVACRFKLQGNEVTFELPNGYDQNLPLVIDPTLVYSSYSGSTADNWGFTATFDTLGNIYSGGIVLGVGFPVTTGAYDASFNGGICDIGILKFNPQLSGAASLLFATYIGGNAAPGVTASDVPHSIVVNAANELLILGTTGSANFPVTTGAYDVTFNGGLPYTTSVSLNSSAGTDLFISKLSSDGTQLLASTFLGGTGTDGLLRDISPLTRNYGDQFRGDIITDASNNVYIASTTESLDFPTPNGFQPNLMGGTNDAVVVKMNSTLSSIIWSTYLGGLGADAAFSIQLDSQNRPIVCGGTTSPNFPVSFDSHKPVYGGSVDGFIARISANGDEVERATFIGTASYDQTYFVQLDATGNVYVLGQTAGAYPVSAGVYSVPNSRQFIHKLNANLSISILSTTFGSTIPTNYISPTAFLVNECGRIYASGWGGGINASQATYVGGTTNNMPVTADALKPTTDGMDFYLIELGEDASSLLYATYLGGNNISDHVDGGTSRFDKKGNVYHAVCACGSGALAFPTTPNAYAPVRGSSNCNNLAFKFAIPQLSADFIPSLVPNGPRATTSCTPALFHFRRQDATGVSFLWNFGDGNTSTAPGPLSHTYNNPGTYIVTLTVTDPATCIVSLTVTDTLVVNATTGTAGPDQVICLPDQAQLQASGGVTYQWTPNSTLSALNIPNPVASPSVGTTTYTVTITNAAGCVRTATVDVIAIQGLSASASASICAGQSTQLTATPGYPSYSWSPAAGLSATNVANPVASPTATTTYTLHVTGAAGCPDTAFVTVTVSADANLQAPATASICAGSSVQLQATANPGYTFSWSPATGLSATNTGTVTASPTATTLYTVTASSGGCTDSSTVLVTVNPMPTADAGTGTGMCEGQSIQIGTPGQTGVTYQWSPATGLSSATQPSPIAFPSVTTIYTVTATNAAGCVATDTVLLSVSALPVVQLPADSAICAGASLPLNTTGSAQFSYLWSPAATLSNPAISSPIASPTVSTTYTLQTTNGFCTVTDSVRITVNPTPTADAGPGIGMCEGQSIQIGTPAEFGVTYQWSPVAGLSNATQASPIAFPSVTTTYTVTATSTAGCVATDTVTLTISPPPAIQMPANASVCPGGSVQLAIVGDPQLTYLWSPAASLDSATISAPTASPAATTTYTVQISDGGCTLSEEVTVTVLPAAVAIASPDVQICAGQSTVLSATPFPDVSYSWWPAAGLTHTDSSATEASPTTPVTYYVQVTSANGCASTDSVLVSMAAPPVAAVTPIDPQGTAPYPVQFTNQTTGATSYTWNFGNNQTSTLTNPLEVTFEAGTYTVVLTSTYANGCTQTDTVAIVRVNPPMAPNIITPNGDGVNDVFKVVLTNEQLQARIYNRWGKLIYSQSNYVDQWGAEGCPDGVYFYELRTPSGKMWQGWIEVVR